MSKSVTNNLTWTLLFSLSCAHVLAQEFDIADFHNAAENRISWRDPDSRERPFDEAPVTAKILGFNDFHGYLNGQMIGGRPVGGAAVLAAYLKAESAEVDNRAVIVHAGDVVGASPAESALQHDEPTIHFLNLLANDQCVADALMAPLCNMVGTLGNHEFDDGPQEMIRLLFGGRHPDAAPDLPAWSGAEFPYVSANVVREETGELVLPPYVVKEIGGVPVAFIGAVLRSTPEIVIAYGTEGISFLDEVETINRYVEEIRNQNIRAIVLTIHHGFAQNPLAPPENLEENQFIELVRQLDDEVDVVISGHLHAHTNLLVPGRNGKEILLTQAFEEGTAYSDIDIVLDRQSREIVAKSAAIMSTWADSGPGLTPEPEIAAFVNDINSELDSHLNQVIGASSTTLSREANEAGESLMGNFLADAYRSMLGVDFAFSGLGRADIPAGNITLGDLYQVDPFDRDLIVMTLTGSQIVRLLNEQWSGRGSPQFLAVSGLSYTWDANGPENERIIDIRDARGRTLDSNLSYRISTSEFFASGGSGFDVFTEGVDRKIRRSTLDVLVDHTKNLPQPFRVYLDGRIERVN